MDLYRHTDWAGATLAIHPATARENTASVDTNPDGGADPVHVPAHKLAEVTAALYTAAGQPVPDLPVICDAAEVERLAELIHFARCVSTDVSTDVRNSACRQEARVLLARGVTAPPEKP